MANMWLLWSESRSWSKLVVWVCVFACGYHARYLSKAFKGVRSAGTAGDERGTDGRVAGWLVGLAGGKERRLRGGRVRRGTRGG